MMTPTNGFTEGQRALIEQTAWQVSDVVSARLKEDIQTAIRLHQAECPVKAQVEAAKNQVEGGAKVGKLVYVAFGGIAAAVATLVGIIKDMLK